VMKELYGNEILNDPRRFGVTATYKTYEQSEWVCYMFGGGGYNGFIWRPAKGDQPNWFWRKMQYLLLGHRWVKEGE
jgi:hypothetical protein